MSPELYAIQLNIEKQFQAELAQVDALEGSHTFLSHIERRLNPHALPDYAGIARSMIRKEIHEKYYKLQQEAIANYHAEQSRIEEQQKNDERLKKIEAIKEYNRRQNRQKNITFKRTPKCLLDDEALNDNALVQFGASCQMLPSKNAKQLDYAVDKYTA